MTRIVMATFPSAEAARRAAVALGRAELAAGPTRVQVDASAPEREARLELRVDEPDTLRAIALMREHGAAVAERDDERDLRGGGPLGAWGMAIADAVTAAMSGATASDGQVPARTQADRHRDADDSGDTGTAKDRPDAPPPIWGNAPSTRPQAGSASGTHLSDTVAAGASSSMGQVGPGTTVAAAMGATDPTGTSSGPREPADPATLERADDVPPRDPRPEARRPRSDA